MKILPIIIWFTQLGLNVALPLACSILLSTWLQDRYGLGQWVVWVGVCFGVFCAIDGFCSSIKALIRLSKQNKPASPPPVSFNEHD